MHENKYDRINTIASKELDRRSVADSVAHFLASGGHVHQVGTTASANRGHGYNGRITRAKRPATNSKGRFA